MYNKDIICNFAFGLNRLIHEKIKNQSLQIEKIMNKILALITIGLFVQHLFAQDLLNELNSSLETKLEICIDDKWHDVEYFKIKRIDGQNFEANVKVVDSESNTKDKEYIISNYTPYYIEDGDWRNINGEYHQKGDIRKIHIYNNNQYGTKNYDFKYYRPDGVLGMHEILNGFYIFFHEKDKAQNFISIAHKLQGNAYNSTPWLRTLKESANYQHQTSKDVFEAISKDFKQYDIKSEQVHKNEDWTKTNNLTITYKYPCIIISHTDVKKTDFNYRNDFKQGTITIKIPINDSRFEFGRGYFGGNDESIIHIYSPSGLKISCNGKEDIIESYNFFASKIICKNLLTRLRIFKTKVLEENYQGEYGYSRSTQKTKPNKQFQKLSGGKYVQ